MIRIQAAFPAQHPRHNGRISRSRFGIKVPIPHRCAIEEHRSVRAASMTFFSGLSQKAWLRRAAVVDYQASVRGLAFHIAAHELHHLRVLRAKYLPLLD